MKIAFLYPQWTGEFGLFGHFTRRQSTWPPLNLALLAAIAEKNGHEVVILEGEADGFNEEKMINKALSLKADIFGLTCYSPFFHLNTSLAQKLKESGSKTPIIVGGPHITIKKEEILKEYPQFDYLFIGESEKSFPKFLTAYQKGSDLSLVEGTILKRDGEIIIGQPQWVETAIKLKGSNIDDQAHHPLDEFPIPARHLLPMKKYRLGTANGRSYFTSIQSMRGCPWKCIFCASEALNTTRMATRSPKSIVNEMKSVLKEFPYTTHFYFVDDVLTLWDQHILEICDLIIAEGLKVTFEGSTRANLVKDEVIARMVEAGLVRLSFGLETVDTEMRKTMNKKVPFECYDLSNIILNKRGVEALNSTMIGLPGETRKTIQTTLHWLVNNRNVMQSNFAIAVPYPGTELHDMAMAGEHGIQLKSGDLSKYLRYGSAVTTVGDLSSEDLIKIQNEAFMLFYSKWWRWPAMYRKHGVMGFVLTGLRVLRYWKGRLFDKYEPVYNHPKDT